MVSFFLLWGCFFAAAARIEAKMALTTLLQKLIFVITTAFALLLFCTQLLSLFEALTPGYLLMTSIAVCASTFLLVSTKNISNENTSYLVAFNKAYHAFKTILGPSLYAKIVLGICCVTTLLFFVFGLLLHPVGDGYHFTMPKYWIQNASMLPFPVQNLRITSFAICGSALALPGYMYLKTTMLNVVISLIGILFLPWLVYSLARQLGFGKRSAFYAGLLVLSYTPVMVVLYGGKVPTTLAGFWSGGSFLFLLAAGKTTDPSELRKFACLSLFLFIMSAAAKNIAVLTTPFYLLYFLFITRKILFRRRFLLNVCVVGIVALVCSGGLWNYTNNYLAYGDLRGPQFIRESAALSLRPQEIWTRNLRGLVAFVDFSYLPASLKTLHARIAQAFLDSMGAERLIAGEKESPLWQWRYEIQNAALRTGLGIPGLVFFLPGLLVTIGKLAKKVTASFKNSCRLGSLDTQRLMIILVLLGTFVISHAYLRWFVGGMLRIMLHFVILGAPFAAILLKRRAAKYLAFIVLGINALPFLLFYTTLSLNRYDLDALKVPTAKLQKLRNHRPRVVNGSGRDGVVYKFLQKESSKREFYLEAMKAIPPGSRIAFVGGQASEEFYLFGPNLSNEIIPLVDGLKPNKILPLPTNIDFLVCDVSNFSDRDLERYLAQYPISYCPVFKAEHENTFEFQAFQILPSLTAGKQNEIINNNPRLQRE